MNSFFRSILDWGGKLWRSISGEINIDDYPVDEERVAVICRRVPATAWGRELMTDAWPNRYGNDLTSETYIGCVAVLLALVSSLREGVSLKEIQQKITAIDESLKTSKLYVPNSHRAGGAGLTIANAWGATESGLSAKQLLVAFDSELIYASMMFVSAREREKAGEKLR